MNLFLCLLGPSLVGIRIFNHFNKGQLSNRDILFYYLLFILVNNFFASAFSVLVFGARTSIDNSLVNFPFFALKYIIISIVLAIINSVLFKVVIENFDYDIEVNKNEKKRKARKSKKDN